MKCPLVSIIIVNYNGGSFLRKCVDSAIKQTHRKTEVLIIDNHSTDGSLEQIVHEHGSHVRIVRNRSNRGYPSALNTGVAMCHGKYVVFLNNDALLHRTAVDDLVREACACPSFDFFQPKILLVDAPDVINSTGISIHYCGFGVLRDAGKSASNCNTPQEISGVHGACFMARSEALRDIGPFDEVFFSFYEDTDLSWRALLKGMRILYVPPARVYHKWGQSWGTLSSAKIRLAERNRLILLFTNYEPGTLLALSFPIICAEIAMLGWLSKRRIVHAKIMAYADLICLREYLFVRRLMIQSTRRVGDLVLLGRFTTQLNQTRLTGPWISPLRSLLRLFEFLVVDRL